MMSSYTRHIIREVPGLPPALANLLNTFPEEVLSFLHSALTDDHGQIIPSNQVFFSQLMPTVAELALPSQASMNPNIAAQSMLHLLITHNKILIKKALNLQLGSFDLIEVAACHALTSEDSRLFLSKLIQESPEVQPAIINKFTAIPGFEVTQGSIRPLNWLLLDSLGNTVKCKSLCEMLEMLVFDNTLSKELAQSLPIDMRSSTLRSQLCDTFIRELYLPSSPLVVPLARLFFVWMDSGFAAKLFDNVVSVLPQIFSHTQQNSDLGLLSALLGAIAIQRPDEAVVFKSSISLQTWLKSLETFTREKALEALSLKADLTGSAGVITICFAKTFTRVYPRMRKQLLTLYADEAEQVVKVERDDKLATRVEEISILQNKLLAANLEIERLKTTVASVRLEYSAKVRGLMEALVEAEWKAEASQEHIWRLERDTSLARQTSEPSKGAISPDSYLEKRLEQAEQKNSELIELVGILSSQSTGTIEDSNKQSFLSIETNSLEILQSRKMATMNLSSFKHFSLQTNQKKGVDVGIQARLLVEPSPEVVVNERLKEEVQPKRLHQETPTVTNRASCPSNSDGVNQNPQEVKAEPQKLSEHAGPPRGLVLVAPSPKIEKPPKSNPFTTAKLKGEPTARPKILAPAALSSPFAINSPSQPTSQPSEDQEDRLKIPDTPLQSTLTETILDRQPSDHDRQPQHHTRGKVSIAPPPIIERPKRGNSLIMKQFTRPNISAPVALSSPFASAQVAPQKPLSTQEASPVNRSAVPLQQPTQEETVSNSEDISQPSNGSQTATSFNDPTNQAGAMNKIEFQEPSDPFGIKQRSANLTPTSDAPSGTASPFERPPNFTSLPTSPFEHHTPPPSHMGVQVNPEPIKDQETPQPSAMEPTLPRRPLRNPFESASDSAKAHFSVRNLPRQISQSPQSDETAKISISPKSTQPGEHAQPAPLQAQAAVTAALPQVPEEPSEPAIQGSKDVRTRSTRPSANPFFTTADSGDDAFSFFDTIR